MEEIWFHVDVNSAFLSWEAVYEKNILGAKTDLREIPAVIGGSESSRHGIVLAKSIPAKKFDIQTGESLVSARKKCPALTIVPPNYSMYVEASRALICFLEKFCPVVEQYSIDEAFCNMTGTSHLYGGPVAAAHMIKDKIREEFGFTVNIGVSNNKLLAKMASDFKKPDMVHTLFPAEIQKKMWPLPVSDLFYVGRQTKCTLNRFGIYTIGELANSDVAFLRSILKSQGELVWRFANGDGAAMDKLTLHPINKGYGNALTIPFDVTDASTAKMVLLSLAETVGARIRADSAFVSVVSVSIVDCEFSHLSRQMTLPSATDITNQIFEAACHLFDNLWDHSPIRQLGVHTFKASASSMRQYSLFDTVDIDKQAALDATIDAIRSKSGEDSIIRAVFLGNSQISHMSGGIDKAKRTWK